MFKVVDHNKAEVQLGFISLVVDFSFFSLGFIQIV